MVMTATPQILKEIRLCAVPLQNVAMDFLFSMIKQELSGLICRG